MIHEYAVESIAAYTDANSCIFSYLDMNITSGQGKEILPMLEMGKIIVYVLLFW